MPRVTNLNREQCLKNDLSAWIRLQMRQNSVKQSELAECIGLSQQSFSVRLAKSNFTFEQLIVIFKKLGADDERIVKLMKL